MDPLVLRADARDLPLDDDSVDLVVTSPPYFALRSYQDGGEHYEGQIGDEPTPAEFVDSLIEVTRECLRVLKPSGSLWVNLGDKYNSAASNQGLPARGAISGAAAGRGQGARGQRAAGVRQKSLIGIPWRYALRCIDDLGLILRAEVIWSKPNGLPESVTDRVRRSHEQWFHFTLEPRYFSAVDEIREVHTWNRQINSTWEAARSARMNGIEQQDAQGGRFASLNPLGKLPGSVWEVPTQPLKVPAELGVDHFAAFPMEWPRRIIQGWSPSGICTECGEGRRPVVTKRANLDSWHDREAVAKFRAQCAITEADLRRVGVAGMREWRDRRAGGPHGWYKLDVETAAKIDAVFGGWANRVIGAVTGSAVITGNVCACPEPAAPTRPAVVLDPFGGTGTTALVAHALGRHGVSVDRSADYCRLARWRTTDPGELARAMQVEKPPPSPDDMDSLLDLLAQ